MSLGIWNGDRAEAVWICSFNLNSEFENRNSQFNFLTFVSVHLLKECKLGAVIAAIFESSYAAFGPESVHRANVSASRESHDSFGARLMVRSSRAERSVATGSLRPCWSRRTRAPAHPTMELAYPQAPPPSSFLIFEYMHNHLILWFIFHKIASVI